MIVSKRRLEPRMKPRVVDCIRFESCSQISLGDKSSQSPTPTPTDQRSKLLQPKGRRKSLFFSSSETENLKQKISPQRKSLLHKLQLNEKQLKEILVISEPQLVKVLSMQKNQIHSLHNIGVYINLHYLDLQGNFITDITLELRMLPKLSVLILSRNLLCQIQNLPISLQILDVRENHIQVINNLQDLTQLKIINLNHNKLESLYGIRKNALLQEVHADYNQISAFPRLFELSQLVHLSMQFNKITSIPSSEQIKTIYPKLQILKVLENPCTKGFELENYLLASQRNQTIAESSGQMSPMIRNSSTRMTTFSGASQVSMKIFTSPLNSVERNAEEKSIASNRVGVRQKFKLRQIETRPITNAEDQIRQEWVQRGQASKGLIYYSEETHHIKSIGSPKYVQIHSDQYFNIQQQASQQIKIFNNRRSYNSMEFKYSSLSEILTESFWERCQSLQVLRLQEVVIQGVDQINQLHRYVPNLKELTIGDQCSEIVKKYTLQLFKELKKFNDQQVSEFTLKQAIKYFEKYNSLHRSSVELENSYNVDEEISEFVNSHFCKYGFMSHVNLMWEQYLKSLVEVKE